MIEIEAIFLLTNKCVMLIIVGSFDRDDQAGAIASVSRKILQRLENKRLIFCSLEIAKES